MDAETCMLFAHTDRLVQFEQERLDGIDVDPSEKLPMHDYNSCWLHMNYVGYVQYAVRLLKSARVKQCSIMVILSLQGCFFERILEQLSERSGRR